MSLLVSDDDTTSWIRLPFPSSKYSKVAQDEHDSSPAIEKTKRAFRPGRLLNLPLITVLTSSYPIGHLQRLNKAENNPATKSSGTCILSKESINPEGAAFLRGCLHGKGQESHRGAMNGDM